MRKAIYFRVLQYTRPNLDLLKRSFDLTIFENPACLEPRNLEEVEVLFAPLGYSFDAEFIARCPRLKVIATNTTGIPHIDFGAARKKNIFVISLKDDQDFLASITPTAELALGLIISLTRNLVSASKSVLEGEWNRWNYGGPFMLSRSSLGIVGLGRLGTMMARYGSALGASVHYYDPYVPGHSAHRGWQRCESLDELFVKCRIITIHVPLTAETKNLISSDVIKKLQPGSYLINTSRGEVVDSAAVVQALESGALAGAGVDVLDGEFDPQFQSKVFEHPLVRYAKTHNNLIITPHIGGSTRDAWEMTQRRTIERVISVSYQ